MRSRGVGVVASDSIVASMGVVGSVDIVARWVVDRQDRVESDRNADCRSAVGARMVTGAMSPPRHVPLPPDSPMSPSTPAPCNHERRPGTTVCLRCRHEARIAGRRRALSVSLRVSAVVLAIASVGAIAGAGAGALQGRQLTAIHAAPRGSTPAAPHRESMADEAQSRSSARAPSDSTPEIAAPLAAAPSPNEPRVESPIVDEGRTELGDGLFAVREGRSVTVHFDVPQARTRRRDKFDRVVRATLPRIYGPVAQAVLDQIPEGDIIAAGRLPADLQDSGIRIPIGDSATIALFPELRDASGGPLVVGYRAEVGR